MLKNSFLIALVALTATVVLAQSGTTKPNTSGPTKVTGAPTKMPSGLEYWGI